MEKISRASQIIGLFLAYLFVVVIPWLYGWTRLIEKLIK
jgi:hypothetical protein